MNFFDEASLRLKQQLKVTEDKQVAEALGMTGSAWTKRKTRKSFPEKELRALAQQRPELGIDVEYVLTGVQSVAAKPAWLRLKGELKISDDAEVAEWLGMSVEEVNAYARRGLFPVSQFLAALTSRSELVDKSYVLTGVPQAASEMIAATLSGRPYVSADRQEHDLIALWRQCSVSDQTMALTLLRRLAKDGN